MEHQQSHHSWAADEDDFHQTSRLSYPSHRVPPSLPVHVSFPITLIPSCCRGTDEVDSLFGTSNSSIPNFSSCWYSKMWPGFLVLTINECPVPSFSTLCSPSSSSPVFASTRKHCLFLFLSPSLPVCWYACVSVLEGGFAGPRLPRPSRSGRPITHLFILFCVGISFLVRFCGYSCCLVILVLYCDDVVNRKPPLGDGFAVEGCCEEMGWVYGAEPLALSQRVPPPKAPPRVPPSLAALTSSQPQTLDRYRSMLTRLVRMSTIQGWSSILHGVARR